MSIALPRARPDLALTLTPDWRGHPASTQAPLSQAASPAAAGALAGLQRRSKSAPDLGRFSRRQAFHSTPGRPASPGTPGALEVPVKGNASATEMSQPACPPTAGASPSASTSSSTTFDRSGDKVSFCSEGDPPLHAQVIDSKTSPTDTPTRLQTLCAFSGPVIDAAAGACSLAAARLYANPLAAKVAGALSGGLWLGGAVVSEIGNAPYNKLARATNFFCGTAGGLSLAAPLLLGENQRNVAYSSAASWVANGVADIACAAGNTQRNLPSRLLQGASGAANMAAAGLAAKSAHASAHSEPLQAANLGAASSALWMVGGAAALGAEWAARSDAFNRPRRPSWEFDSLV